MTTDEKGLTTQTPAEIMESVVIGGDLSKLTPQQRVSYYKATCESLGLNPLTRPFDYITLNQKLTLYAKKDATDQLRRIHEVSIDDVDIRETDTQFIVKVKGHDKTGRTDVEVGVVNKSDMRGDAANAQMKAVTKGKRRLTLSLVGLGWLDETEVATIPDAMPVTVTDAGEIVGNAATAEHGQVTATEYWLAVKAAGFDRENGLAILKDKGGFTAALAAVKAQMPPEAKSAETPV